MSPQQLAQEVCNAFDARDRGVMLHALDKLVALAAAQAPGRQGKPAEAAPDGPRSFTVPPWRS